MVPRLFERHHPMTFVSGFFTAFISTSRGKNRGFLFAFPLRKWGACTLLFLSALIDAGAQTNGDPIAKLPQLLPERCAMQAPDAMLAKLLRQEPVPEGIGSCDACVDHFYEVYAEQLSKKTDSEFPETRKFRGPLLECFQTCFQYLAEIHHHNGVKHYSSRIPGQLEWILYHAATQQYSGYTEFGESDVLANAWMDDDSKYTPVLIEQIALAIGKANAPSRLDHFDKTIYPILKRALSHLAKAEESMTEDQKLYFRRYLALFITRFP